MFLGQGFSFVCQAAYFILLARLLGVREYGVFAGANAFVGILAVYSAMGSGTLLMRYVGSGSGKFSEYWGNVLFSICTVGTIVTVALYLLAHAILSSSSASAVLLLAIGNCIFNQFVVCTNQVFQTMNRMRIAAILSTLTNAARLIAVIVLALVFRHISAWHWAFASALVSMAAALVACITVTRQYGLPKFESELFKSRAVEGFSYSFGGSAQSAYNDIDKTVLSHYNLNLQNGIYSMAYRIIDMSTMPITALDLAALPRYFRQSSEGIPSVIAMATRLAKRAALIGLFISIGVFVCAPLLPHLVGREYATCVSALQWLCLLPIFRGAHQLTGSALAGMGLQKFRIAAQFGAAGVNLCLNLWLIPSHGWLGAAWASIATDALLAIANSAIVASVAIAGARLQEA